MSLLPYVRSQRSAYKKKREKKHCFSHAIHLCQARLLWLGVALLVDVVVLLWLCGVEGALRCMWMKNEVGHVTTSRTTNGSCGPSRQNGRAPGCWPFKSAMPGTIPRHSRRRQGAGVVAAACVWPQASRCKGTQQKKESQSHQHEQMVQIPSASKAALGATIHTTWRRRDAPSGRRVEAGQGRRRVLCMCVCRGGCRGHATNTWPRPKGEEE
jgi:Flp pilus assembly protein TadB